MYYSVEILPKGSEQVRTRTVRYDGREPALWGDDDVRAVMKLALATFDEVVHPEAAATRQVALRGLSWIVTRLERGVAIAMEIPSGAVVAGPFEIDADVLTGMIARVMRLPETSPSSDTVH
jgi:hypothetical protein